MYFTDYHLHTENSEDSQAPMLQMAAAAKSVGMSEICFTDHIDLDRYDTGEYNPEYFAGFPGILSDYASVKDSVPGIRVKLGLELGEGCHHPEEAKKVYNTPGLDFVIGSVHALRGRTDFCLIDYVSEAQCRELNREYLGEYLELARLGAFDVLGHIGYTSRYMAKAGFKTSILPFGGELEELFRTVIESGKGIEVNTAGLRSAVNEFAPVPEVLRIYRRMGGEIITAGSDAHNPRDAGRGISEAYELIRQCGFKYISVFREHKPEFIKI